MYKAMTRKGGVMVLGCGGITPLDGYQRQTYCGCHGKIRKSKWRKKNHARGGFSNGKLLCITGHPSYHR
jgi:hypothetical protein